MYLNAHTYYSLHYGTLSPEELVLGAVSSDIDQFVLTDINNSSAIPDFVRICLEHEVKPIGGIDFRNGDKQMYIGIARNKEGMRELNEYLTEHLQLKKDFLRPPKFDNAYIVFPLENVPDENLFSNERIGVRPYQVRTLLSSKFLKCKNRLVILHSVAIAGKEDFSMHCHLRAIEHNILYSRLTSDMCARKEDRFVRASQLRELFKDYDFIVDNTLKLLSSSSLEYDLKSPKNKSVFSNTHKDDIALLSKLANDGLKSRYSEITPEINKRLEYELSVIDKMNFAAYFLITWDIIRYSMSRDFYHVGRGSGANSLVAYCLKITDVDPIELDLYFERFLNPRRSSPPDFDIDYSWKERDEVRDYIFKRYGSRHIALLGTFNTFKTRSILRELSKVQGLPKSEIDNLVAYPAKFKNKDDLHRQIFAMAARIVNFPNLRSIHAGGILISDEPLTYYTALDLPPTGFPTVQWDMYVAENLGYEKLDILSQRGIGHVKEAAEIISEVRGINVDVHNISKFKKDPLVRQRLYEGETLGCFYIESPAMRGLLKKLRCRDYISLVAASSIIRPGVARSGMMKEYIRRFNNPNDFDYLHPIIEEQLKETYGVMVYQEDVLKVCHHFAGLDLADADVLRRAMSGKSRSPKELDKIVQRFFANCRNRNYPEKLISEVWRQIESFAGYAFSKAHSASYAVESFQSLYLKTYYPLEFMVAVINNFGGFYTTWVYFNEAKRLGAKICTPCVNRSKYFTRLIDADIIIGFVHVESLERRFAQRIVAERKRGGDFVGLFDFMQRVYVGVEQMHLLIRVGAFSFTEKPKAELLWELHAYMPNKKISIVVGPTLFEAETKDYELPELVSSKIEDAYDEIELIGFPVTFSWFDLLSERVDVSMSASNLKENIGKIIVVEGLYVTLKYVKTVKGEIMNFVTWVDSDGNYFDSVHFPDSLKIYPFRGHGVYVLKGKVVEEFGYPSIEVSFMEKQGLRKDPRSDE